jgi:hypothetical protein
LLPDDVAEGAGEAMLELWCLPDDAAPEALGPGAPDF